MKKFTSPGLHNMTGGFSFLVAVVMFLIVIMADTGRAQDDFASAEVLNGDWGSVTNSNNGVTADSGGPNIAGFIPNAPLWYQWTAPRSGDVELDTLGSVGVSTNYAFQGGNLVTNIVFGSLDTVLGVYTGSTVSALTQVAANDNLYPYPQENETGQNIYDTNIPNIFSLEQNKNNTNTPYAAGFLYGYDQPYIGPSGLHFYAIGGVTYYFAVDTKGTDGQIVLNWAYHSSGVFRWATDDVDQNITDTNGNSMLLYQCAETETSRRFNGTVNADQYNTTFHTYYTYDAPGVLVTVTRTAGSTGRVTVGYTTVDGTTNMLINGDTPAKADKDYIPVSGTLTFNDFEMSKTILISIIDDGGKAQPNRDFTLMLTNAQLDPNESSDVSPPRIDTTYYQALVRILDVDIDPKGESASQMVVTNGTMVVTNLAYTPIPTNAIFNFQKANYRVTRDVTNYWGATPITVYVTRTGTNTASATVYWTANSFFLDNSGDLNRNNEFPLQSASDYATPDPANSGGVLGLNSDFDFPGGYSGTLTFPGGANVNPQPITFTIYNNGLQNFAKDIHLDLYELDSNGNPIQAGMVAETTVTILFDDIHPPSGSVDENYNPDYGLDMVPAINTSPLQIAHPGVDTYGEVYDMAIETNGEALIAGDFVSYNGTARSCIALIQTNGALDQAGFNPGSGANGSINAIALLPNNQIIIGGAFSSYNGGSGANGLARLNANGTFDSTFNTGLGVNGAVRAIALMTNGEVVVGGDFTQINGITCNYIALIKTDGTVDQSFNASNTLSGSVYALAVQGNQILVGGDFTVNSEEYNDIVQLNSDGSINTSFNPGTGADNPVYALGWQTNRQVVVGGAFTHINNSPLNYLARLNADGSIDTTNFLNGIGADDVVYSITLQTNDTIYVGGQFTSINETHRLGFARLYSNGTVDTTFLDTAYNQFAGLPRIHFDDQPGTIFCSAIQSDGNVIIGGSFGQVGGGQFDPAIGENSVPANYDPNVWPEPKVRDGIRNRSNVARLIGGSSPGPGNVGFQNASYSADKTSQSLYVGLTRANGSLGPLSANFAVQSGLITSGTDYIYNSVNPLYWIDWEYVGPSRMHSDGLFGTNGFEQDIYGNFWSGVIPNLSSVPFTILNNTASSGNLGANFQLTTPSEADNFYLGGQDIPLSGALGASAAPFTLIDNNQIPGTFGFVATNYISSGLTNLIALVRTNGVYGTYTLRYSTTTNGTAVAGTDYVGLTNVSLTWLNGYTTNSFNLVIKASALIYTNIVEKTVGLALANLSGPISTTFTISNAVVRLINPNYQGYLTLSATNYNGLESSGYVTFVVNRTSGSQGTLTIQYATVNGTALSGTDYIGATNTLVWNNGDVSSRTITIPLINNEAVGINKQFTISLSNPTLNNISTPSLLNGAITNATLTIIDDNSYGAVQFSAPTYLVNEIGGYATVTVVRNQGLAGPVSVNFATSNGANTQNNVNYTQTNGTLTFAVGQLSASFNVPILNNGVIDPAPTNFYFNVTLSNPTNTALGSLTNALVEIVDAQTYNQPPGSLDTGFNSAGMNGDVLSLALQSTGDILAAGNFTAVGNVVEDRIARLNTDGSLDTTFSSGANGAINTVVDQTDDRILVGGSFTLINGAYQNSIARLMTDGSVDSSFNPGSGADNAIYALAETFVNGNREIYVGGAFGNINSVASPGFARLNNNGSVDSTFATGTAADGQIYAIAVYPTNSVYAGKVLIGGTFDHFNGIALPNLARLNVDGSVDTNFTAGFGLGPNAAVRSIAIQSDGRVLVGGDFTNFNGTILNHIARLNTDGTLDTNFTANVGLGANDSVEGITLQPDNRIVLVGQFTQVNGVTRNHITRLLPTGATDPTINFGEGANGNVDAVVIQPANGMLVVGGSFSLFNGQSDSDIARIYGGSETGSGQFEFSTANYQVNETGVLAPITVIRTGGTAGPNPDGSGDVSVTLTTSNGTAVAGVNYSPVTTTVSFPPGEISETVNIPVFDDGVITPNLTVNLALSDPSTNTTIGNQPTATLTILNDDSAVSFSSTYYSQVKNTSTGVAVIDVIRQGGTNSPATVNFYTTTNGMTAVPGIDYYSTNTTITFNPGQSDVQVQVPIISNGLVEGNTTVGLELTNAVGTLLEAPSNATLTIIDTTPSPGRIAFTATNFVVDESAGIANLTLVRTNGTTGKVSAYYTTIAGTAQPNVNYVPVTNSVTFLDGSNSAAIPISLVQNGLAQGPVSFSVALSDPSGGALLIAPSNTTVTVLSDNVGVAFLNATNYFSETNSFGYVVVQRLGDTNLTFNVNYATTNGTALSGVNYQGITNTLTFPAGQVLQTIPIPLINTLNTTNVTFGIQLYGVTAGALVEAPSNTLVVIQPAMAGLSFTNSTNSVQKNVSYVLVPVVCSNPSIEPVPSTNTSPLTVNFSTADGTAQAGVDYMPTNGTLIFTNGLVTNYFRVPIINNSLEEGNLTFSVNLSNPTAPGKLVPPSTQLITILDDNSGLSFSSPTYTVLKTNGIAIITVLRTDYTNTTSAVSFETADGTAVAGQDYVATNGTFVFTNGQTAQTFSVAIIGNSTVQPDKTVLLQLFNATNGFLVAPYAATLTIHDTSGSLVVPAGSVLVSGGSNGIIDPGDKVSLLFGFRASGGTNVTDVSATLLQTNGITSPSGSQNYGTLIVNGPSASRQFSFTANGTNSQQIAATFQLQSAGNNMGTAVFTYSLGTWTTTFYNTNAIVINESLTAHTIASPYPSFITVTNVGGDILKATATLTNIVNLTSPESISVLLVSPAQADTLLMANVGGNDTLNKVTLTFDDASTNSLPEYGQIVSGTNKPTAFMTVPPFP